MRGTFSFRYLKVIEGHLILGAALYTNILLRPDFRDILAMSGSIAVKKFLGNGKNVADIH